MATHWWIGGSGTWNSFNTANWSTTGSGGPPGSSVPSSGDDVVFDSASGATNFVVTVDSFSSCKTITVSITTVGRITFASPSSGGSTLFVYGNLSLTAQTLFDPALPLSITMYESVGAFTINTNNARIPILILGQNVGTQTYTLSSALTVGTLQVLSGTFNTANFAITTTTQAYPFLDTNFIVSGSAATTLTLGSSVINVGTSASETAGSIAIFRIDNSSGLITYTANTATITVGSTSTTNWNDADFYGGGFTYATVVLNGHRSQLYGANTFATRFAKNSVFNNSYLKVFDNQILNSGHTFQLIGTISARLLVMSGEASVQKQFALSGTTGTRTLSYVSFMSINLSFGSSVGGTSVGDMLGNLGITFDAPRTLYLVLGTATKNFNDSTGSNPWSLNPIGIPVGAAPPLPQDTVIFNANSGSGTLVLDTLYLGTINTTGFTGSVSVAGSSPNLYDQMYVLGQPTDPAGVLNSYGGGTTNVIYRFGSNITLPQLPGNYVYLSGEFSATKATLSSNTATIGLYVLYGAFDTNSFNLNSITLSTFYSGFNAIQATTAVTKTLSFGSSYITLTGNSPLNLDASTVNAGTSTIEIINSSGTSSTLLNISGKTLNNLKLTKTSIATDFVYGGLSGATFNNITVSPHTGLIKINLANGTTTTVNSLTTNASKGNGIIIGAALTAISSLASNATLAIGSNIVTEYVAFLGITKSGASTLAPRGAADLGANVGITFDPHIAVAFSGSGATSFAVPDNFSGSSYFLVLGAGGGAGKRSTSTGTAGGGGGGAVAVASNLNVSRGQTIYLNAPTGGAGATASGAGGSPANAWVNIAANSQPTLNTNGAYADSGNGSTGVASTAAGAGGTATSSLGHLTYSGGNGGIASTSGSAGGGSVGSLIFRLGGNGGNGSSTGGAGGGSIQNSGSSTATTTGGAGGAVSPNPGGAGGTGGASPQPGGSGIAGSSVGGGGGGSSTTAGVNSGNGGAGAAGSQWTYRSLNGVLGTGTIGYGGAGGGGGGISSTGFANSRGGDGGNGRNGSGGGGGGRGSTTGGGTGNGGNGGDALILFVYVESKGTTFATIIG